MLGLKSAVLALISAVIAVATLMAVACTDETTVVPTSFTLVSTPARPP